MPYFAYSTFSWVNAFSLDHITYGLNFVTVSEKKFAELRPNSGLLATMETVLILGFEFFADELSEGLLRRTKKFETRQLPYAEVAGQFAKLILLLFLVSSLLVGYVIVVEENAKTVHEDKNFDTKMISYNLS